jgi:2-C-methyl-D-erythritol 4-phosphate cytidylyltransferase
LKKFVIIVAGGSGSRMGTEIPKQFLMLQNKPILLHTIERFLAAFEDISFVVVLPKSQISYWVNLCSTIDDIPNHEIVAGGETRFHSSFNGIQSIHEQEAIVAIHDGVRPFPSIEKIITAFKYAEESGNAVFSVDSKDSIRLLNDSNNRYESVPRDHIKIIQTPQIFKLSSLQKAFETGFKTIFTDDASVVENAGEQINLVEGNYENIKITTPEDLLLADIILNKQKSNG